MTSKTTEQAAEERNWPEDFQHENGNYNCICCQCENTFIGHKRRIVCRACSGNHSIEHLAAVEWLTNNKMDDSSGYNAFIDACKFKEDSLQATLSEYKQKVDALEGENAELLSQLNDATFEIQTGVDIVEGLQAENERLRNMLKYAAEGYSDLVEYQLLSDRIKNELQQVIDKIESVF